MFDDETAEFERQLGKLEWKPGTPEHIKAAGAVYKKWLHENQPSSRLSKN